MRMMGVEGDNPDVLLMLWLHLSTGRTLCHGELEVACHEDIVDARGGKEVVSLFLVRAMVEGAQRPG